MPIIPPFQFLQKNPFIYPNIYAYPYNIKPNNNNNGILNPILNNRNNNPINSDNNNNNNNNDVYKKEKNDYKNNNFNNSKKSRKSKRQIYIELIKLKYIYIKTKLIIECRNGHLINFMKILEKLIK